VSDLLPRSSAYMSYTGNACGPLLALVTSAVSLHLTSRARVTAQACPHRHVELPMQRL
jgi:hypothetical protein